MSKVTSPGAGEDRLTVKVKLVVPELPSFCETSPTDRETVLQECSADAVFRGAGAPAAKSLALLSVSVQPWLARWAEVVFESVGAGAPSEKFAPSYPIRSTICASCKAEQGVEPPLQVSPVVVVARITFPPVALMLTVPVASGVGSGEPVAPPACWTRKYWPGPSDPDSVVTGFEPKFPAPVALAYCTDIPASETDPAVGLKISTKSLRNGAPALPPPPYT